MIVNKYSKPFTSIGGFKSRIWHCYGIEWYRKAHDKRWGYWQIYFDGAFHHFGLGVFTLFWWHRPDMQYIKENNPA